MGQLYNLAQCNSKCFKIPPKKVSIRKHWDPNLSKKDISIIPTYLATWHKLGWCQTCPSKDLGVSFVAQCVNATNMRRPVPNNQISYNQMPLKCSLKRIL